MEASSDLPLLVRDGRRVFPLWRADLRHEVRKLDLRWLSGGEDGDNIDSVDDNADGDGDEVRKLDLRWLSGENVTHAPII